jgi:hypothetical protein
MAGGVPARAAEPTFVGSWNITFALDPGRTAGATQCIVVIKTGTVAGLPLSGTWTSPTFSGWGGQWIELGDHVRWFGVTGGGLSTEESGNVISASQTGGVSFNHFFSSNGTTSSAGSWIGSRVSKCTTGTAQLRSSDPSK